MLCGDTELNSGPMSNSSRCFQFVTGALTAANNFSKISLLKAYNAIYIPMTLYVYQKLILTMAHYLTMAISECLHTN